MTEVRPSTCRICNNMCGILTEIENGKVLSIRGDPDNPYSRGYICLKGLAYPGFINGNKRLLRSLKRNEQGKLEPIPTAQALDEIAAKMRQIISEHGPNAVANYTGTIAAWTTTSTLSAAPGFMEAIGSWMSFNPATIDQPGRPIAQSIQGYWQAPFPGGSNADAIMLFGINSLVSYIGLPTGHIARFLDEAKERDMELIVIDPRKTELARRATLHIQPRPGTDTEIAAALLHVILNEGLEDHDFLTQNAEGVDALRAAVDPFTPEAVACIADIDAAQLYEAARSFAAARRGYTISGTGPNMGQPGTLLAYLLLNLDVVCGHLLKAGDMVPNVGALGPKLPIKAQVVRGPVRDPSHTMQARSLASTVVGPSLPALPEQMRIEGPDRVRALISCGGNPVSAWPDQENTIAGLKELDLLVAIDAFETETTDLAHYVIAPRMGLEQPSTSQILDLCFGMGHGPGQTYGLYTAAVAEPPEGADVLADWEVYYELAKRLGVTLSLVDLWGVRPSAPLDMVNKQTCDQVLEIACRNSVIPLDEVKLYPHGKLFTELELVVAPRDPDNNERLRLADPELMAQLEEVADRLADGPQHDFRLISRRMMHVMNSTFNQAVLKGRRTWNPAYLNPADMEELGLKDGDIIAITAARGTIHGAAEADSTLRRGVVSMAHSFGNFANPDDPVGAGANTSRLIDIAVDYDPYSGQPRMSNIAVTIEKCAVDHRQKVTHG